MTEIIVVVIEGGYKVLEGAREEGVEEETAFNS